MAVSGNREKKHLKRSIQKKKRRKFTQKIYFINSVLAKPTNLASNLLLVAGIIVRN